MGKNLKPWEAAARRSIMGKRVDLETLDDCWIVPRKYGVVAAEEIEASAIDPTLDLPGSVIKKIMPLYREKDASEITEAEFASVLTEEEFGEVMKMSMKAKTMNPKTQRLILLNGIGEHNLTADGESSTVVAAGLVDELMQYADVVAEMVAIIEGHNSPLSPEISETSETLRNGSTQKPISEPNVKTSKTGETQ